MTLAAAIENGLMPDHLVLDIGAGSLRVGWWLLQFVVPSNYHAIEPVRERIDAAAEILGADDIHVYYNDDFTFPNVRFDFVIARSIWTHASKAMIAKMLSEFAQKSSPDARFLTSVILARSAQEDYKGGQWVGRVEKEDSSGLIRHSRGWIERECAKNGLSVEVQAGLFRQMWLLIRRAG